VKTESRKPKSETMPKTEDRNGSGRVCACSRQSLNPFLPLPAGEGRGEGELPQANQSRSLHQFASAPRLRLSVFGFVSVFGFRFSAFRRRFAVLVLLLTTAALLPAGTADRSAGGGDAVECANVIYAGTKSSVCFSEEFLSAVASETSINTSRKFKPVKLAEKELFRFPFAIMTGEGAFTLTEGERKNLKQYLEKGGFLLASAGCSSKEWGESFAREMALIFPDRKLADVPMDHAIFRTVYDVKRLDTSHGGDAKLQGLTLNGKIVLVYSPDGLNDTATMHGCCCCGGNEIKNSQKVNANILAYALLQ
jgi:hypothetical protein